MPDTTDVILSQIREIEQRDENQIMNELAGETVADYIYEIVRYNRQKKQNERVVKLSWVGVREVARSRGNIIVEEPIITETDDAIRIVVRANDLKRNFSVFGGCHQPKKQKVNEVDKNGEITSSHYEDDDHYFPKGLSKAQRNALNLCIPGEYAAKLIDKFLRASGRPPLLKAAKPEIAKTKGQASQIEQSKIKSREQWDKITSDQIPDFPKLEPIIWTLCKIQPTDIYKELGVSSRNDMTIPAWEAFLQLKERYAPADLPNEEPTLEEPPELKGIE